MNTTPLGVGEIRDSETGRVVGHFTSEEPDDGSPIIVTVTWDEPR